MVNTTNSNKNSKYLVINSKKINLNKISGLKESKVNSLNRETNNLIDSNVEKLVNDDSVISNKKIYKVKNLIINNNVSKDNSSSTKEWANSVYAYNKNYIKNLPAARNVVNNLLNCYFNLTRLTNGEKSKSPAILEKRNSLNKTFVSKSEIKVTNDKVNLTVYIYNKNKKTILNRLSKVSIGWSGLLKRYKRSPIKKYLSYWHRRYKLKRLNRLYKINRKNRRNRRNRKNNKLNRKLKIKLKRRSNRKLKKTSNRKLTKRALILAKIERTRYLKKKGTYFLNLRKMTLKNKYLNKNGIYLLKNSKKSLTNKKLKNLPFLVKKSLKSKKLKKLSLVKKSLKNKKLKKLSLVKRSLKRKPSLYFRKKITKIRLKKKIKKNAIKFLSDVRKVKYEMLKALDNNIILNGTDINEKSSIINIKSLLMESFSNYELNYYMNFLNALCLENLLLIYYYREIVINNNKFKNWFLFGLKKTLSNLYNKKVELNIVNQKYFYLNSDIFTKALATRVRDRNNRILAQIKKALSTISLAKIRINAPKVSRLVKPKKRLSIINNGLKRNIFNGIRYKHIQGVRIAGAGRLSQRLTAARALYKLRSRGSLKNTQKIHFYKDFAYLRNNVKPNVQYTNLNSKTRNGAFGLKGWISSN